MKKLGLMVLSLFFLLLLSFSVFGTYAEWWQFGTPITNEPNNAKGACGRGFGPDPFVVAVTIPPESKMRVFIPRVYEMNPFGNRFYNIPTDIKRVPSLDSYELPDCGDGTSFPGPFAIIETSRDNWASTASFAILEVDAGSEEGAPSRTPGSVFDGKQQYTGLWPYPSNYWIESFKSKSIQDGVFLTQTDYEDCLRDPSDCDESYDVCISSCGNNSGCQSNCQTQKENCVNAATGFNEDVGGSVDVVNRNMEILSAQALSNEFPPDSLRGLSMLSNGREGLGSPCYVAIEFDNTKKEVHKDHWKTDLKTHFLGVTQAPIEVEVGEGYEWERTTGPAFSDVFDKLLARWEDTGVDDPISLCSN